MRSSRELRGSARAAGGYVEPPSWAQDKGRSEGGEMLGVVVGIGVFLLGRKLKKMGRELKEKGT